MKIIKLTNIVRLITYLYKGIKVFEKTSSNTFNKEV